ncbi:Bromodomain associated domain protein [Tolypocladium paradoxum]|uniref:Bromodomain associated domain protein n=1 Tax=Tolypocladium paradoxum TaxID=94208 RepID=A0A2S4KMB1_9HYPO|nr:Bromodomain associated domain protein [Tolypocladium paradoxum]
MSGQSAIFHALLRPVVLQILRATGYHSTKGAVLDTLTDLAARYMSTLCEATAAHAIHNHGDAGDYTVVDVRIALQDVGALQPDKLVTEQRWKGEEDMRGVEQFLQWFSGPRMKELMEMGKGDGESDATDYLSALTKKHSKTGDDTKWHGTILGNPLDTVSEIQVEGGPVTSIEEWIMQRSAAYFAPQRQVEAHAQTNGGSHPSPSASSGLSSVGDRLDVQEMDMT